MNIMLVSQCNKKALTETRRIIDQFAERRGDRTWQTPITSQGLSTLRKLLKQTARRNTAVACHWIRRKDHTELLWIVGNAGKFNEQGAVPTNITRRDVLKVNDENSWHTGEDMALLAGIAALFHDFGKANSLFQKKLTAKGKGPLAEPYRHEWVSLRMFEAFVGGQTDQQWLTALSEVEQSDNDKLINQLIKDHPNKKYRSPFDPELTQKLPPTARAIAWLILTHHKLPRYNTPNETGPDLAYADMFLDYELHPSWNSPQINYADEYDEVLKKPKWQPKQLDDVWVFKNHTPVLSKTWRAKAQSIAKRALNRSCFINKPWLNDTYTLHLARMVLMLADHHYSSLDPDLRFQDKKYKALANTYRITGEPKQKLDEHLIGVYRSSLQLVRTLPMLKTGLSSIARHEGLKKRGKVAEYQWQDKAYDLARSVSEQSANSGFFGINMASTGKGKTFANAKIMYGLANAQQGCRFSIALGLRTLTLQTGQALTDRLRLDNEDIAVLVGSQSVKQLFDLAQKTSAPAQPGSNGSESSHQLLDDDQYVAYEGVNDGPLFRWLEQSPKAHKMVNAPIMVSTIDHLIPATESDRGGKQITPMLRLLTADLVLDEIDDFDLKDLPAICRLVNWAGLLGSRVLLSSATLPPSLVATLFDAYAKGRAEYQKVRGVAGQSDQICCAWFDEFNVCAAQLSNKANLLDHHNRYVEKRIEKLLRATPLRKAEVLPVSLDDADMPLSIDSKKERQARAISALANKIYQSINQLHRQHPQIHPNGIQQISVGLVRMANINPLVAVAKQLMTMAAPDNCQIHYCVYHSRHPLVVRSAIEKQLDQVLQRGNESDIWQQPSIKRALANPDVSNHIFVVLASPVCEVGRDHDYDWAIVEPSSMRSIIQLAGRVQRHRKQQPTVPNIHLLSHNYKALCGNSGVFSQPGFETGQDKLAYHNMAQLLQAEQYQTINAISRVRQPVLDDNVNHNLASFEHYQLLQQLDRGEMPASLWWQQPLSWSFELQRRTRFRSSQPTEDFVLKLDDEQVVFHQWHKNGVLQDCRYLFETEQEQHTPAAGIGVWGEFDYQTLIEQTAQELAMDITVTEIKFGTVSLMEKDLWWYSKIFGFYIQL